MQSRLRIFRWARTAILAVLTVAVFLGTAMLAQNSEKADKPSRRLIYKVDPDYPWDLKRAHIGGVVRLTAVITPRGTVDNISVTGGNPVLVDCALRAVKKWKYAPADFETILQINVAFNPDH